MKKMISLLLVLAMALSLVACGGSSAPAATEAPAASTPATTEAPAAEMTAEEKAAAEAEIRYALALLLDRNYIVEEIAQGGQLPASSFVPMGMTEPDGSQFYENAGHNDGFVGYYDVSADAFEDNYAKAYEILSKYYEVDENGMFTNFPTLTYLYNTSEGNKAIGEYIQSALAAVGINIQLENQEWATFLNTRKSGDYSIARNGWLGDYNDPISFLDMWITASGNNDVQFGRGAHETAAIYDLDLTDLGYDVKVEDGTWAETYDVLIGYIKTCTEPTVRFEMMHRAEDMLMSTGAIVPLYFYTDPYMLNINVEGFYGTPLGFKFFDKTTVNGNNDVQFGRGAHETAAIYDLDLTDLGYDVKVEDGTWAETYDVLIGYIKTCTEPAVRFEMMHRAEDMLMSTGAIVPLYFYTDPYMLNSIVEGFYGTPLGFKFFDKCTVDGSSDSISVCIASEPDTIDPALNSALDGGTMTSHLFAGLTKWAVDEEGKTYIAADCLTELPEGVTNDDGTVTYTYTLKDGLKWSDGQALTAADFEFAWKRAASSELGADYQYMFDVIKGYPDDLAVTALDDTTLEVTLNNYVPYWNELMAFPTYFPVREDVVANEAWATDPSTYICNGRYTLTGWDHNSVITMTKNENYHDADSVVMNEIKFYLSDDANTNYSNYKAGAWQLIDDLPSNEIPAIKAEYTGRADKRDEYIVGPQIGTYYACWNINEPLLP